MTRRPSLAALGAGALCALLAACSPAGRPVAQTSTPAPPATVSEEPETPPSTEPETVGPGSPTPSGATGASPSTSLGPTPSDVPPTGSPTGPVPVISHIRTTDPVVFITIDDGYEHDPAVVDLLRTRHVPVTPFLTVDAVGPHHAYFSQVQDVTGQHVQDHTISHPDLRKLDLAGQTAEICGAATTFHGWYGQAPWLLRPPYGSYDDTTRRAARACGMTAIVLWDVSLPHHVLRYGSGTHLRAGDIVIVHWRPNLARDLPVILDAAAAEGLRIGALQDYLPHA